jgi:hypothetical protein
MPLSYARNPLTKEAIVDDYLYHLDSYVIWACMCLGPHNDHEMIGMSAARQLPTHTVQQASCDTLGRR